MLAIFRKFIKRFSKYSIIYENAYDLQKTINFFDINVVIDIGASSGGYAKSLRRFGYKNKIISFEPVSFSNKKLLAKSTKDSKWLIHKRIIISNSKEKKMLINVSKDYDNSSILGLTNLHLENHKNAKYTHSEEVECDTLDNIINYYSIDNQKILLKIDVQGSELDVLKSGINNLKKFKLIQVELSVQNLYQGQTLYQKILNFMKSNNYEIWNIFPGYKKKLIGQLYQFDALFYNKKDYL